MATRCWRRVALVAGVLGLLGGAQACTEDGVSLHVICPIHPTVDDDGCTWEPEGELCVAEGVMNLFWTTHYSMFLRAESGLKARSVEVPPRGESSGIQIRSAEVEVRLPSGAALKDFGTTVDPITKQNVSVPNPFTVVATGYIHPEGVSAVGLTAIDDIRGKYLRSVQEIAPLILVSIKLKGVTNGAQEVKGGEFIWPIRLSNQGGCVAEVQGCANMIGQDDFALACGG